MMLVESGIKTVDFGVIGEEHIHKKLPFQAMSVTV
jgi:hypothetical protein